MHKEPNQETSAKSSCTYTALREGNNISLTLASDLLLPVQGHYFNLKPNWSRDFYWLCSLSWSKSMFVLTLLVKILWIFSFNPPCTHFNLSQTTGTKSYIISFNNFSFFPHIHAFQTPTYISHPPELLQLQCLN